MGRRRAFLLVILTAVAMLPSVAGRATPGPGPLPPCVAPAACPDLLTDGSRMAPRTSTQTFGAAHCDVVEGMVEKGTRRLLRFNFTTPNLGVVDLVVGPPNLRPDLFEFSSCHGHYHFRQYADYRLWTPDQFAAWDALRNADPSMTPAQVLAANPGLQPVVGGKRGFCVIDLVRYTSNPLQSSKYDSCDFQGISSGWADEYYWGLPGQYVDVTGLAAGPYVIEGEVNAERVFAEGSYANNRGYTSVTLS